MNPFHLPGADLAHIVKFARPEFLALRDSQIFLTGGTGFFGRWLLAALFYADGQLGLNLRIGVLSRAPEAFLVRHPALEEIPNVYFLGGDVADFALEGLQADFILHAATDTTAFTTEEEEAARDRTITEGTRHVLDFAAACGAQRLLNISSGAVYGSRAGQLTGAREEEMDAPAVTAYGQTKREAEQLCADSGVSCSTARAFAFLGPLLPLNAHFAAGNFLRDGLRGGPILVRGDGTALRSYLHPSDLVVWLLRILVRGQSGCAYNVGSDEVVSTKELAARIAAQVDPAPCEVVVQSAQPQGPANIYLPHLARAREELGLEVAIRLDEAIARTLAYHRVAAVPA